MPAHSRVVSDHDSVNDRTTYQAFYHYGLIAMEATLKGHVSITWEEHLCKKTALEWLEDIAFFTSDKVKTVFNQHRLPTLSELATIDFDPDSAGCYADLMRATKLQHGSYVYPGCAVRRPVGERTSEHDQHKLTEQ